MKLAIITVTGKGAALGARIARSLDTETDVFVKTGRGDDLLSTGHPYDSLSRLVDEIFSCYDGLIFIMATGIVVRMIASHIRDKRVDPAVVVLDEKGQFAISLLAGHIGGANELARDIANRIGAQAVITTATDVEQKPAADVLAVKLDLAIEPFEALKSINAAIVNGDRVAFFLDHHLINRETYRQLAAEMNVTLYDMEGLTASDTYDAAVVITDKDLYLPQPHLYLRPPTLALGIGCRKGTSSAELYAAICDACRKIGRSPKSIAVMGTSVVKQEEIGLLALGEQLGVMTEFFGNDQINQAIDRHDLRESAFVRNQIGVGSVCEPSALLGARNETLLLHKTRYPKITVAIAEVKYS